MKIYISVDMEGITGVNTFKDCRPGNEDYTRFRKIMTQEINAVIAGAKEAGAKEFVVNDAHGTMTNILIEELDPAARLISGSNKHLCQMEGIDDSFDGVFFVGYHAGDGFGNGTLNHTVLSATVFEIKCNGKIVDEAALNAGLAGHFNVPVLLLVGDNVVCDFARKNFVGVKTAQVKEAIDRVAVNSLSLKAAWRLAGEQAKLAIEEAAEAEPYAVEGPVTFTVTFRSTSSANMCTLFPQVKQVGPNTIEISGEDYLSAYRQLWGLLILGRAVQDGIL